MLTEEFFSAVSGPPLAANTSVPKDAGAYHHSLLPNYAVKATFKKSSAVINGLAINENNIFIAQQDKSHVHVYSRSSGKQEALVVFPERLKSITLENDVLVLGTTEGRIILWEICTGRQVITPPCHVQAVTCLATTPFHLLSGSDDSNVHVWSIPGLLEYSPALEPEPLRTLSDHRGPITAVAVGRSVNPETSICITAGRDKACIIWNYQTGESLRTLLFSTNPNCLCIDPCSRAIVISCEDGALFLVEFFGDKPLLGTSNGELASSVVQAASPLGISNENAGPASCLAINYEGTVLLSGHPRGKIVQWSLNPDESPKEIADLNAAVTNLAFDPIRTLRPTNRTKVLTIIKPTHVERQYSVTAQLNGSLVHEWQFDQMLKQTGFPRDFLEEAIVSFEQPQSTGQASNDELQELQSQNEELREIIKEQSALLRQTLKG